MKKRKAKRVVRELSRIIAACTVALALIVPAMMSKSKAASDSISISSDVSTGNFSGSLTLKWDPDTPTKITISVTGFKADSGGYVAYGNDIYYNNTDTQTGIDCYVTGGAILNSNTISKSGGSFTGTYSGTTAQNILNSKYIVLYYVYTHYSDGGDTNDSSAGYKAITLGNHSSELKAVKAGVNDAKDIVSFNGNGGDDDIYFDMSECGFTCAYNSSVTLPANQYLREGYRFSGWNSAKDGSGTSYEDESEYTCTYTGGSREVTLYAQWEPYQYDLSYDALGGYMVATPADYVPASDIVEPYEDESETDLAAKSVRDHHEYGDKISLSKDWDMAERAGYTFLGWSREEGAKIPQYMDKEEVENLGWDTETWTMSDVALYAVWADNTDLEDAIKRAEALDSSDYTADSWEALKKALNDAKDLLARGDATQDEVDAATKALLDAIGDLKKRGSSSSDSGSSSGGGSGGTGRGAYDDGSDSGSGSGSGSGESSSSGSGSGSDYNTSPDGSEGSSSANGEYSSGSGGPATENPDITEGTWETDSDGNQKFKAEGSGDYLKDGYYYVPDPDGSGYGWYHFDKDGNLDSSGRTNPSITPGTWEQDPEGNYKFRIKDTGDYASDGFYYVPNPDGSGYGWYYFDKDGFMRSAMDTSVVTKGTWEKDSSGLLRFKLSDGTYAVGGFYYIVNPYGDGSTYGWYYFNEDASMHTGWLKKDGRTWYYCHAEDDQYRGMMEAGWRFETLDGRWYFLSPYDGRMVSGWQNISSEQYYFELFEDVPLATWHMDESGIWTYDGSGRSYGSMYIGEVTKDGLTVDSHGALVS